MGAVHGLATAGQDGPGDRGYQQHRARNRGGVRRRGAHVVISGRSAQRGAQVVGGIRSRGGRADFVMAELDGSAEASRSLAEQATSVLGGRIDILVNNAGIYPGDSSRCQQRCRFCPW
jgi:NAD(P)-dependent dehydrogenase (short-subunit alcohol dehydrogenase family)